MKTILTLFLVASFAFGGVDPTSCHTLDAIEVAELIESVGYQESDFSIVIQNLEDEGMCYLVNWPDQYYSAGNDEDLNKVSASIVGSALISMDVSWHSEIIYAVFSNGIIACSTSDAQWFCVSSNDLTDNEAGVWFSEHVVFVPFDSDTKD